MSAEGASPSSGPGQGHVPRAVVVLMSLCAASLAALTLYSMWAFWPVGADQRSTGAQQVAWFGWHPRIQRELLFFLTVALAGGLGGLIHTVRSFAWYVGNRELRWSWVPYNALLPVVGALAGTVFYLVLRAGLFSPSTSVQQASPFGFAAIAILAGLFSSQAFEKLRQLAGEIFTESPPGEDHVDPRDQR
jgi:hypothetical protein